MFFYLVSYPFSYSKFEHGFFMHYEQYINNMVLHNDYENVLQPPIIDMLWEIYVCCYEHFLAFAKFIIYIAINQPFINLLSSIFHI